MTTTQPRNSDPYGEIAETEALKVAGRYELPADRNTFELAMMHAALEAVTQVRAKLTADAFSRGRRRGRSDGWSRAIKVVESAKPECSNEVSQRGLDAYRSALLTGLRIAAKLDGQDRPRDHVEVKG